MLFNQLAEGRFSAIAASFNQYFAQNGNTYIKLDIKWQESLK